MRPESTGTAAAAWFRSFLGWGAIFGAVVLASFWLPGWLGLWALAAFLCWDGSNTLDVVADCRVRALTARMTRIAWFGRLPGETGNGVPWSWRERFWYVVGLFELTAAVVLFLGGWAVIVW